jgi:hypothetical protein
LWLEVLARRGRREAGQKGRRRARGAPLHAVTVRYLADVAVKVVWVKWGKCGLGVSALDP